MALRFASRKTAYMEFRDYVIRYVAPKRLSAPVMAGEVYLPPGIVRNGVIQDKRAFETILRSSAEHWGIRHHKVKFLVPDTYVAVRRQLIPNDITDEEMRGYIYLELGRSIHLPFDNPTFDFTLTGEKEGKRELIIFAAPEEAVQSFANALERAKLHPAGADIAALALYQLHEDMGQAVKKQELLLLKLDVFHATVTIFHEGYPVFMQHETLLAENMAEVTAEGIVILDEGAVMRAMDEVLEELDRILHFYQYSFTAGNGTITSLLVTGDHPMLPHIAASIQGRFTLQVQQMQYPVQDLGGEALAVKYYPALGLAYGGG